jgi:hypothetical protein
MTSTRVKVKPLSERPLGYILAAAGGILGGPFGVILSLLVLFSLAAIMKPKDGDYPNRFLVWSLIGIIGAPLSLSPFLGSPDKKVDEKRANVSRIDQAVSDKTVPLRTESLVREDRSLLVTGSNSFSSLTSTNQFLEPVTSKGGRLIVVYITIKNTGKESGNMYWTTFDLVDSQGRKYDVIEDVEEAMTVSAWAKDQGFSDPGDQLFPGAEAYAAIVFRVSPDATGLRLLVNGNKSFATE